MLARTVKESWIQSQLRLREKEYVDFSQTKIFCGTWNVGGEMPPDSLEDWLCKSGEFDIFALSFQELDLTAGALLGNTSRSIPWEQLIYQTLNNSFNTPYRLLMSKQLVGMLLCIFVKENMLANISDIKSSSTGVGLMGMMGNKGGVAIRFTYFDTSICFVNSHLSAHKEYELRRNQDYRDICRRIFAEEFISIFEHECLLWMGDLNYRFDNLTDFEVKYKIMKEAWSDLLDNDQLYINQKKGLVFEEFLEAPLQFAPTFKYDPNSTTYDTSEKRRVPAWCDRVLWRGSSLENKGYNRCEIMTSDHRPVFSLFNCQIKKINMEKRSIIQHEITKLSDKKENDFLPNCSVSTNHLLFTPVRFSVPINQSFSLNNIGQVPAQFNFIPKTNQKNYCKEWLRVVPSCGIILPGEVIEINVTILVTSISAPSLHSNRDTLDDFIVLHLEGGKDHYVTIKGEYLNSCFGNYIEELVLHPLAVRSNKPINLSASSENNKRVLSIPKELWHLVNYLFLHALDYEDLFQQSGNQAEIEEIQELLDTAAFFKDYHGSIDSVAESLIRFLDCLAEPVVHYHLYEQCVLPFSSFQQSKQIISSLKTVNYNVFYYLISFLREVLEHANNNKLTAEKLANLFASVLIKPLPKDAPFETAAKKSAKADFIFQFLTPNFV